MDFIKQLYEFVDGSVSYHLGSTDNLKEFLMFLSGFHTNVSMRNKILTFGYDQKATDIRTKEDWERDGYKITNDSAVIYNIAQVQKGQYAERIMYDVTNTDANSDSYERFPNAGFFAERLLINPPCPVRFSNKPLKNNRRANYDVEKGVIEVTGGYKNETHVCYGLLREFAHFYLCENEMRMMKKPDFEYNRDKHGVEAQAVSFAVCSRYGIEPPSIDVLSPPNGKPQDLLKELELLDTALNKISKLIDEGGVRQRRFLGKEIMDGQER